MKYQKPLTVLFVGLVFIALFVFPRGILGIRGEAQVRAELDAGWTWLEQRAGTSWIEVAPSRRLDQLLSSWKAVDRREHAPADVLEARAKELIALFEQEPNAVPSLDTEHTFVGLVHLAKYHLEREDLSASELEAWLRFGRRLNQHGPLLNFGVGSLVVNLALQACERDPSLQPRSLPPVPDQEEIFSALCRGKLAASQQFQGAFGLNSPSEAAFLQDAIRLAIVRSMQGVDPARPTTWEQPRSGQISSWRIWRATVLRDLEGMSEALGPLLGLRVGSRVEDWHRTIERWQTTFSIAQQASNNPRIKE